MSKLSIVFGALLIGAACESQEQHDQRVYGEVRPVPIAPRYVDAANHVVCYHSPYIPDPISCVYIPPEAK